MKTNFKAAALFATDGVDIITLCRGTTVSGEPFYAFLKIKPSRFAAFEEAQGAGFSFDLQDYGEILAYDYADMPPQKILDEMRKKYGNNTHWG